MIRGLNRDRKAYGQRVLDLLRKRSPAHAEALNAQGTALGWWDMVNYYRIMCKTPDECATGIERKPLTEAV